MTECGGTSHRPDPALRNRPSVLRASPDARLRTVLISLALLLAVACGSGLPSLDEIRDLHSQGRFEETIEPLKATLAGAPENHRASLLLGIAYYRTARPSLAVWPLRKAEESPEFAQAAGVFEAMASIQSRNHEDAIYAVTRVLELNPDHLEALGLRAQARLAATKDLEEALVDINRVFELDPENGTALQPKAGILIKLERIDEAGEVIAKIEERSIESDQTGRGPAHWCVTNATFAKEKEEYSLAEARFEGCLEKYPEDSLPYLEAISFYTETGRSERAEELLREGLTLRPAYLDFAIDLANRLRARNEIDEAAEVLQTCSDSQVAGQEFDALWALVEHYEAVLDFDEAAEILRRAIEINPDPRLLFRLVDILIRSGRHSEAMQAAAALDQELYVELAKGRILLDQGRPREALGHLAAGLRLWPNNPGARYYAAIAAEQIGDFDRAIREYRDSVRSGSGDTDAGLRLAQLLYAQGTYSEAKSALDHHVVGPRGEGHGQTPETLELNIKLSTVLARRAYLREWAQELGQIPGYLGLAVSLEALASSGAGGRAAVVAHIRQSGLDLSDPANIEALRTLIRTLLQMGAAERALAEVDGIIADSPSGAVFQELRAQVLRSREAGLPEIRVACERARNFDPNAARNLACLAWVEGAEGNTRQAIALYESAANSDPEEARYPLAAASLLLAAGEENEAARLLGSILLDHPLNAQAPLRLARYLVERGEQLKRALALARRAIRFQGGAEARFVAGWAQLELGDAEGAITTLTLALKESEGSPSVRFRLAQALLAGGRSADAREALTEALKSSDFPERAEAAADLKRLTS
jgi:tetratricopeptide (TPR) repeat protein